MSLMEKGLLKWLFGKLFGEIILTSSQWSFQYLWAQKKSASVMSLPCCSGWIGGSGYGHGAFNGTGRDVFHALGFTRCITMASGQLFLIPRDDPRWNITVFCFFFFLFFPQWFISSIFFPLQWCIYTRPNKTWTPNSSAQFNSSKASLGIKGMFEQPPEWQVKSIQDSFNVFLFNLLLEWCSFA